MARGSFSILAEDAVKRPTISGISPTSGAISTNNAVTITGANFKPASVVKADGVAVASVYVSPTQITATIPGGGAAKTFQVTVTTDGGASATAPFAVA
jgi:uncharacterized protein (TIGR03437 family)